jgi:hypothetical protein
MRALNSVESMMVSGGDISVGDDGAVKLEFDRIEYYLEGSQNNENGVLFTCFTLDGWSAVGYTDGTIMSTAPDGTQTFFNTKK